jgi:hypothetical protein
MARGILSEYGRDANKPQVPRATKGGITRARDVNNYQKPQGPTSISNKRVGLGGENFGYCGSQGHHHAPGGQSGGPGLGGERKRKGSQK